MTRRLLIVAALVLGAVIAIACGGEAARDAKDCGDFEYQQDAQTWWERERSSSNPDPSGLDGNDDQYVCERLPERPR